nr:unnamed protein product [Callosobruchus analis]
MAHGGAIYWAEADDTKELNSEIQAANVEQTCQGITDLRNKFDEMQIRMEMIKNSTEINKTEISSVFSKIGSLEQTSKRSNLRFFGLRETTDILTNKMKLNSIRVDDIEAAYRVGTAKPNTPRAVVVKSYTVKTKDEVYSKKKVLKGSRLTVREDLFKARMDLVKEKRKINDLENLINDVKCDVFANSETWLDSRVQTNYVNIDGYKFLRKDRGMRGVGVGLYISNKMNYKIIPSSSSIEQL